MESNKRNIILAVVLLCIFLVAFVTKPEPSASPSEGQTETDDKLPTPTTEIVSTSLPEHVEGIEEESTTEVEEEEEKIMFRVTAYCACSKCCGKWASMRPLDENGNQIVSGAAGIPLTANVSCASPYPFGTEIELDGLGTFVVEDRTAQWVVDKYGENIVDVYMTDHDAARQFGLQYVEGVIK